MVAGLVILLECCETRSFTLPMGDVSAFVGEDGVPGLKCIRGGERGDSTLTEGVSWGEDCMTIDMGRLWLDLGGEVLRPRSTVGVRGVERLCDAHGETGRGRSKEALTVGAAESGSSMCKAAGAREGEGLGAPLRAGGAGLRPSNFARSEETGFMEASSDSAAFWSIL